MNFTSSFSDTSALVGSFGTIVITVLGLVFNILTVFVLLKSSKLKSNSIAPLICGLAVSDITFCFSLILLSIQYYQNEAFPEGSFLCYFTPIFHRYVFSKNRICSASVIYFLILLIRRCSFMSSVLFVTLISVQRLILIGSLNQNTQAFTWKKTFGYFCLLWTIMMLIQLLPALRLWGQIGSKDGLPYCTMWSEGGSAFTDINRLIFLFGYFAPLISLIACYKLIYKVIKESTTGRDDQVNKTAFIVIGSFVFVFTPDVLVYTFNKLPGENAVPELHVAVYLLAWSHAFINPIIYIFFNEFYRKEFCRILKIKVDGDSD